MIDIDKLDNPYVQVIWEDYSENFTQEQIKSVKQYFQNKYNTNNVNVISKIKNDIINETQQTVDVSINIMDKNYQKELIKNYLVSKNFDSYQEDIIKLDNEVENKIAASTDDVSAFKKWYIKRIEFSNFLSYGDNQVLDFTKCNGLTVIKSTPENFGGKTVISTDLLLFLFFNTTTKTSKVEDVFNKFTEKDYVRVKGEITIDGEDYVIERNLERKKSKSGDYNIKTYLEFFKKLPNGELQNFTGEQRKETENFIKNSIGEQNDFLMTILTTASNLEELLESKPTTRGQILSRFLGLEFLKKKEEVGKEFYSEFSKSMLSNIYNIEQLKQEIENNLDKISEYQAEINQAKVVIEDITEKLTTGKDYKDNLLKMKYNDIDKDLLILNPEHIKKEIDSIKYQLDNSIRELESFELIEPSEFYNEDIHDKIKSDINEVYRNIVDVESKIKDIKTLQNSVSGGVKCEHCGIDLINAAITQSKISNLESLTINHEELKSKMDELSAKDNEFLKIKRDFDKYEKDKLIKVRLELNVESNNLKYLKNVELLNRYNDVQDKISKNKEIEAKLIKANLRIDELERDKKSKESIITSNQVMIKNIQEKNVKNNDYIIKIGKENEREKIYKIYSEIFGKNGITKNIMKTMMPLINSELQRLLQDSAYFKLEIRISDKNEVEFWMIDNSTGVEKLMISGSGYEKTIASLALRAVLSKVCSLPKPNIIVMDEVFGKISNENLEMVGEFFVKIKEYFEKVFVISHNPLVNNWADSIISIEKIDNISCVTQ
jgi:DNA repair exonuclease SbcCD ATPase subunit